MPIERDRREPPRRHTRARCPPRGSRAAKTAESIALGNFRELREMIIGHFAQVNKRYGAWDNDTLLHIVCREGYLRICLLYTSPSPRDATLSRMPSSA